MVNVKPVVTNGEYKKKHRDSRRSQGLPYQQMCINCIFCEEVEDEDYMACQARQMLIMPDAKACDLYDENGCICPECTGDKKVFTDINEYMNELQDEYINTTTEPSIDNTCDCDECCNANSYPVEDVLNVERDLQIEDLVEATDEVINNLGFLGDGVSPREIVKSILSLEATLSLLKRYLIEYEDEYLTK